MSLTSQNPAMVDKPTEDTPMNGTKAPVVRDLTYAQIIFWAAVIGIAGGLVATAYYYLLYGAHLLTPMPYHLAAGKTSNGNSVPMYILARLNVNGQGISLANIYRHLNVGIDSANWKQRVEQAKAE